jgi:hypothetical protein
MLEKSKKTAIFYDGDVVTAYTRIFAVGLLN